MNQAGRFQVLTLIIKRNVKIILVIAICLLCIGSTYSKAVVSPTSQFYVNDYANLLSDDTKQYIINMNHYYPISYDIQGLSYK